MAEIEDGSVWRDKAHGQVYQVVHFNSGWKELDLMVIGGSSAEGRRMRVEDFLAEFEPIPLTKGAEWTCKHRPEEQVEILGFGESVNGIPIVRYMGDSHRALALSREDFLSRFEPRRRTIFERLLDDD